MTKCGEGLLIVEGAKGVWVFEKLCKQLLRKCAVLMIILPFHIKTKNLTCWTAQKKDVALTVMTYGCSSVAFCGF